MTNPVEAKEKFYEDSVNTMESVPKEDKPVSLGNDSARAGTEYQTWEGVIGWNGIGKCNSNGLLILKLCTWHDLLIANRVYCLPNRNKTY